VQRRDAVDFCEQGLSIGRSLLRRATETPAFILGASCDRGGRSWFLEGGPVLGSSAAPRPL